VFFGAELPAAVEINVLNDRAAPIKAAVSDVHAPSAPLILVVHGHLPVVRRASSDIIPALGRLPVSIIGHLRVRGISRLVAQQRSHRLMPLRSAVGFVVDDAT